MAVKPIISTITPWDSTVGTNITFTYSGNLPVSVKGTIKNASTLATLWTHNQAVTDLGDGRYAFYIQPNTLKTNPSDVDGNGYKYCIQLVVTDQSGATSAISDKEYFWCLKTPEFYYTTPTADAVIEKSYIDIKLHYSQANGEKLYNYRHYLYDSAKNIVAMSDPFYDESGLEYSFKGLSNKTFYYIRTQGVTKLGMPVDTGYTEVFLNYGDAETYAILDLTSDDNATVYGASNLICIDADEDPNDYIFIGSYVQLIAKNVTYQTNYTIQRDFTLQLKITKLHYNGIILRMYNKDNPDCIITIDSYVFDDGTLRYCLKAFNGIATYVLYTPALNVQHDDIMVITVRRVKNVFSLTAIPVIE